MRERIDAYILLDFLEGWRTRLKNDRIIVPNVIWAAKVEQSIKDLSRIIDFVKAHSKTYDNDRNGRQKSTNRPLKQFGTICWTTSKNTMPPASNTSG